MLTSIAEKAVVKLLGHGWTHRRQLALAIRCNLPPRAQEVRFAFSSLLKLACGNDFVLIRNSHRPETFSPIGGVVKYKPDAASVFDEWDVKFQLDPNPQDLKYDLRGFVPQKHLPELTRWYATEKGRETHPECITREITEELSDAGIKVDFPTKMHFRYVRTAIEPLRHLITEGYYQHRIFDIYEPDLDHSDMVSFCDQFKLASVTSKEIVVASRDEIYRGRANDGQLISPISRYLFSREPVHPSIPMISAKRLSR